MLQMKGRGWLAKHASRVPGPRHWRTQRSGCDGMGCEDGSGMDGMRIGHVPASLSEKRTRGNGERQCQTLRYVTSSINPSPTWKRQGSRASEVMEETTWDEQLSPHARPRLKTR